MEFSHQNLNSDFSNISRASKINVSKERDLNQEFLNFGAFKEEPSVKAIKKDNGFDSFMNFANEKP